MSKGLLLLRGVGEPPSGFLLSQAPQPVKRIHPLWQGARVRRGKGLVQIPAPPHCGEAATGNFGAVRPQPTPLCVLRFARELRAPCVGLPTPCHRLHLGPSSREPQLLPVPHPRSCPYLDGERVEVVEHDVVGFGQQGWVTLGQEERQEENSRALNPPAITGSKELPPRAT